MKKNNLNHKLFEQVYKIRKIEEKILWPMEKQKLLKYRPFFSIDLPKYKRILVDFYKQV